MPRPAAAAFFRHCFLPLLLASIGASAARAQQTIRVPTDRLTIQAAIDAANAGDIVLVSAGTYFENIDFKGKAIVVKSTDGPAKTIIDGALKGPVVTIGTPPPADPAQGHTPATLNGFTVQNGVSPPTSSGPTNTYNYGSGVDVVGDSLVLNNTVTRNNSCGIDVIAGTATIQGNTISSNIGANTAGADCRVNAYGILVHEFASGSNLVQIIDNVVEGNENGGIDVAYSTGNVVVTANTIRNNHGGLFSVFGLNLFAGYTAALNNLVYGNDGGGIYIGTGDAAVANNTVFGNGLKPTFGNTPYQVETIPSLNNHLQIVNNVIVGTGSGPVIDCMGLPTGDLPTVWDHNDVFNTTTAPLQPGNTPCAFAPGSFGNISADPLFVNSAGGDFHLQQSSPAVDSGNTSVLADLAVKSVNLPVDFEGSPRVFDASGKGYPVVDMGAYEFAGQQDASPTTLLLTPSAVVVPGGSTITLTGKLFSTAGTATGPVTFTQDGNSIGAANLDSAGSATLQTPALLPGLHAFVAAYAGQGPFPAATSVHIYVVVDKYGVTVTLTSTPNPSIVGQTVTFKGTVTSTDGTHPGPITINDGYSSATLTPDAQGVVTFTDAFSNPGSAGVTASYAGDATHVPASAVVGQVIVVGFTTTTSITSLPNPANAGQTIDFAISVLNTWGNGQTPTGSVNLFDGATLLANLPLSPGTNSGATGVSYSTGSLSIGTHTITATYVPTGSFAPSSAGIQQHIAGSTTLLALTATPNPVSALDPVTLSASLTYSVPTGTNPTGTVTFLDGTTTLGTAPVNASGRAVFTITFGASGVHDLQGVYSGDSFLAPSTSNTVGETVRINATSTSLTVSPLPSVAAFSTITLTSVTRSPATAPVSTPICPSCAVPSVSFLANGAFLGAAPVDAAGTATRTFTLPAGTYSFSSAFLATPAFSSSTSASVMEIVTPVTPPLLLTAQPNPALQHQTVTFTAGFASSAIPPSAYTGTVTFLDGATVLGASAIAPSGTALSSVVFSTAGLGTGTHQITAVYSGNATLNQATATVSVAVLPQDFTISLASPSLTLKTEHHGPITVTITTAGALQDTFHLFCGNLPEFATCAFQAGDLTVLTPASSTTLTSTLTIDTDAVAGYARIQAVPRLTLGRAVEFALLLPITLLGLAARRHRLPRLLLAAVLTLGAGLSATGCSGKLPGHTPPGIYNITIIGQGRSSGITHSTVLTLTVTQ